MSYYNIITLTAKNMVDNDGYDVVQNTDKNWKAIFRYNFSVNNMIGRNIILSEKAYPDNALFYQIRKCLTDDNCEENENLLREKIVFIDFKYRGVSIFSNIEDSKTYDDYRGKNKEELKGDKGRGYRLRWLFDPNNGIQITFDGVNWTTFVPFDKSNSMARDSRISFIDKDLKKELDRRLLLDIDFRRLEVIFSKFYSYRGLYLSTGYRIDTNVPSSEGFVLNHETVVVLPDKTTAVNGKIYTAKNTTNDINPCYEFYQQDEFITLKSFDGEGLVCPQYAEYFNNQLRKGYGFQRKSCSFQVRMPFTKGMLHEVDFHAFLIEQFENNKEWDKDIAFVIEDIYGRKRDLRKARIILTESMFKCSKWLKDWAKLNELEDPMQYYFEKFNAYSHALYITNIDARFSNLGCIPLNYQFLSTLDIHYKDNFPKIEEKPLDFASMIRWHIEHIERVPEILMSSNKYIEQLEEPEDIENENGDEAGLLKSETNNVREKCLKALALNKAFITDQKIKEIIKDEQSKLAYNLCKGRLEVAGEQRFMSCDLLEFLRFMCSEIINIEFDKNKNEKLRRQRLYSNHFYMPGKKMRLKADKYYSFLRNPHLSRNEQCILRPYVKTGSLHDKYFSHLKGVVMFSVESLAPMTLGGADFDGDLVKIICDQRVVEAVIRSYKTAKKDYKRKLAVVCIPSPNGGGFKGFDNGTIPFQTVKDTFSNNVGLISNYAVKIADKEYVRGNVGEYKDLTPNEMRGFCCAGCTVVTGLEIDSAKTGVHPKANIQILKNGINEINKEEKKTIEKNSFLDIKKSLKKISGQKYTPWVSEDTDGGYFSMYLSKKDREDKKIEKAYLTKVPLYTDDAMVANIERLPGEYLKYLKNAEKTKNKKLEEYQLQKKNYHFKFETEKRWKTSLCTDKKEELVQLMEAFKSIKDLARRINRFRGDSEIRANKWRSYIYTLLAIQYDDMQQKLPCGIEVENAVTQTYDIMLPLFDESNTKVKEAIERLIEVKWAYLNKEQCIEKLPFILGIENKAEYSIPTAVIEILTNFNNKGYMILYYLLKEIKGMLDKLIDAETYIAIEETKEEPDFVLPKDNTYFNKMWLLYMEYSNKKREHKREIEKLCREELYEIFAVDMDEALKYVYAASKKYHDFLWEIFTNEEILRNVYVAE